MRGCNYRSYVVTMDGTALTSSFEKTPPIANVRAGLAAAAGRGGGFADLFGGRSISELALLSLTQGPRLDARTQDAVLNTRPVERRIGNIERAIEFEESRKDAPDIDKDAELPEATPQPDPVSPAHPERPTEPRRAEGAAPEEPAVASASPGATTTPTAEDAPVQTAAVSRGRAGAETLRPKPQPPERQAPQTTPAPQAPQAQVADSSNEPGLQPGNTLASRTALAAQAASDKGGGQAAVSAANQSLASSLGNAQRQTPGAAARAAKSANATASPIAGAEKTAAPNQATPAAALANPPPIPIPTPPAKTPPPSPQPSTLARTEPSFASAGGTFADQLSGRSSAPITAPKPPPPPPMRLAVNQVAVQIQKAVAQGQDRINIQLKPAELGRVEIRLDVAQDGRVSAVIAAERPETLDLLQRDARALQNALQDAGLQTNSDSLSFALKGRSNGRDRTDETGSAPDDAAEAEEGAEDTANAGAVSSAGIVTTDRVDIQI